MSLAVVFCLCGPVFAAPPTHTISGVVATADAVGVEGVTVAGDNGAGSTITSADGAYSVVVPNQWTGTIAVSKAGWLITPGSKVYTASVKDDKVGQDYVAWQPTISGFVRKADGTPLAGAVVTADNGGGSATTDASGTYEIVVPYEWSGAVSASLAGFYFSDKNYANVVIDKAGQDFSGFQPTISGSTGISGATVTVSGVGVVTSTPDYTVTVPYGWSGIITAELVGYGFTNSPLSYANVTTNLINQDFTPFQPIVSGSTGVAGVTVMVSEVGSVVSTPEYSVVVPYEWSGTVEASLTEYHFPDSPKSYTNVIADQTNQDFTPYQPTISGTITEEDGTPVAGVTVTANNGGSSDVTDLSGYYEISVPYAWNGTVNASGLFWSFVPEDLAYSNVRVDQTEKDYKGTYFGLQGKGTQENPYIIQDVNDFDTFASDPNYWSIGVYTQLATNIDLADRTYATAVIAPEISNVSFDFDSIPFKGVLDGNGFIISNLIVAPNTPNCDFLGLIGYAEGADAEIKNLGIEGVSVIGGVASDSVGGLCGANNSINITDCYANGIVVSGDLYTGGLCGYSQGTRIIDCYSTGMVNGFSFAGGLFGFAHDVSIASCHSAGTVNGENGYIGGLCGDISGHIMSSYTNCNVYGYSRVGGFCGRNLGGLIENSHSTGDVSATRGISGSMVGGFCGQNTGSGYSFGRISNCSSTGNVDGTDAVGGFCGKNPRGRINESYAVGNVSGVDKIGGFCGEFSLGEINNCYANGEVNGREYVGGFCGVVIVDGDTISTCYSTGIVNGIRYTGGFCGRNNGVITSCFWDIQNSGLTTSSGGTGLDTAAMRTASTYASTGWEFPGVWSIYNGFTYPYLNWQNTLSCIVISEDNLSEEISFGELNSFTRIFTISNACGGTLNWQIDIPVDCQWLIFEPMSGQSVTEVNEVTLSIDPAYVEDGLNTCQITVSDPNAVNSPQVVTVVLEVLRPEILVGQSSFSFACDTDDPNTATQVLSISNSGYDTLNWQIVEDCDWLSVSPESGVCVSGPNEVSEVTLAVDTSGLAIGYYDCQLMINDENASNSPVTIPVSLHVYRDGERHVPMEYATISSAFEVAIDGDHIVIHPGRYNEYLTVPDKRLVVRSVDPTDPVYVDSTIIERGFYNYARELAKPLEIEGLSFISSFFDSHNQRGFSGLHFWSASVEVRNCIFKNWPLGGIVIQDSGDFLIENCLFAGNRIAGVHISFRTWNANVEINNCTIVDTLPAFDVYDPYSGIVAGIRVDGYDNNQLIVNNSILSNIVSEEDAEILFTWKDATVKNSAVITHSCISGGPDSILIIDANDVDLTYGPGNIEVDPEFVSRGYLDDEGTPDSYYDDVWFDGDYHLKSTAGRFVWDGFARADFNFDQRVDLGDFAMMAQYWKMSVYSYPEARHLDMDGGNMVIDEVELLGFLDDYLVPRVFGAWVVDDVSSPCIDAGDPNDVGWRDELWPHGGRVNMGAYGGTAAASMSANPVGNVADLDHDDAVDLGDWSLWADDWLAERVLLDSDLDRDGDVDPNDLGVLMDQWLWESDGFKLINDDCIFCG